MEESESLSDGEKRVLSNLHTLELFSVQKDFTESEVTALFEIIVETIEWVAESIDSSEVELSLQIMELLDFLDTVRSSHKKIDFRSRLGDSKIPYIIKENTAACYQVIWNMEKSGQYLADAITFIDSLIAEEQKREGSRTSLRLFELNFLLVKSHLQYAAILSHLLDHEKALKQAHKSKEFVKDCARMMKKLSSLAPRSWFESRLDVMLEKFIFEISNRDPTYSGTTMPKTSGLRVGSKMESTIPEQEKEAHGKKLNEAIGGQTPTGIIFWKHNPKNNEKYLKKELAKRYGDSFNGKKMNTIWLEEFNIGNIMHLNPVTYKEMMYERINPETIMTEDKLVELVLVYSCCLFSIATENRFICHKELETDKKSNELSGPANQVAKNYQLLQNNNFKQS